MADDKKDLKVLIVGSGISGLLLAQILRKAGVRFDVFERDDGTRSQGWSVGLDKLKSRVYCLVS